MDLSSASLLAGRRTVAEDLVQTVLLRLVTRGMGDLADPMGYLRRSLVNEHRDQARRRASHRKAVPRLTLAQTPAPTTPTEDRLAVLGALEVLTARERALRKGLGLGWARTPQ